MNVSSDKMKVKPPCNTIVLLNILSCFILYYNS